MKKLIQISLFFLMIAGLIGCNTIGGEVTDEDLQPLEGVTITLMSEGSGEIVATTTTDADGAYSFTNLNSGSYTVEASYDGMEFDDSPASTAINFNDSTVDFIGYLLPVPTDLGLCEQPITVQLFSQEVADTGLHDGILYVEANISQSVSSGTFTCNFSQYGVSLSGEIDDATYTATNIPDETINMEAGGYDIEITIHSMTFTTFGECSFDGTASATIVVDIPYWWDKIIKDPAIGLTTDF